MKVSYAQLLSMYNEYMNDSGLRDYCTKKCNGWCCGPMSSTYTMKDDGLEETYDTIPFEEYKCKQTIGCRDKLPCVMYDCPKLTNIERMALGDGYKQFKINKRSLRDACERMINSLHDHKIINKEQDTKVFPFSYHRCFSDWNVDKEKLMAHTVEIPHYTSWGGIYGKPRRMPKTVRNMIRRCIQTMQECEFCGHDIAKWEIKEADEDGRKYFLCDVCHIDFEEEVK